MTTAATCIDPLREFGGQLLTLENPARYLGGEFGQIRKFPQQADFVVGIGFPDIYEIGMSNTAIKLIYSLVNAIPDLAGERVFTPWPDFEALLRHQGRPLCTLESGIPLRNLDVLGISIGFELSLTNALTLIDLGGLTLLAAERSEDEPLVIAGGPVTSNPLPYGPFFDGIIIGEAEACLPDILIELRQLKLDGARRVDLVAAIARHPAVWSEAKASRGERVHRAVWADFATVQRTSDFPVPSIKIIQDYASLEIMRGCPQGCRFCHAGIFYRPYRQKSTELIKREVADFICNQGFRDVSLASLSSGDYPGVAQLYRDLNAEYQHLGVSFAMPSLKVNSFTLPLLAEMSKGKKSGLTFAVETASPLGQLGLNKQASLEDTLAIMHEAKSLGWKSAKLYFMIGLPIPGQEQEMARISDFLHQVRGQVGINLNVTCGTFVPKPHTAFQWAAQIDPELAYRQLSGLKQANRDRSINISYQTPFYSYIEGIISRGDRRAGMLALAAWQQGARFDGWDDKFRTDIWRSVIEQADWDVRASVCSGFAQTDPLPWGNISLGVSNGFLVQEYERSQTGIMTARCASDCGEPCGACTREAEVIDQSETNRISGCADSEPNGFKQALQLPPGWTGPRLGNQDGTEQEVPGMVFGFSKSGNAAFIPHLGMAQVLERSLMRSGLPFRLSPGFSPHPVMELSQALSLGLESDEEICLIQMHQKVIPQDFLDRLAPMLPEGMSLTRALGLPSLIGGRKRPSLGSLHRGASYWVHIPSTLMEQLLSTLNACQAILESSNAEGSNYVLKLRSDPGPASLRQLFEPVLGPSWQASGIQGRRLSILAGIMAGEAINAFEGDYFSTYSRLLETGW